MHASMSWQHAPSANTAAACVCACLPAHVQVGIADWDGSDVAYPALAVFPGELTADISFKL